MTQTPTSRLAFQAQAFGYGWADWSPTEFARQIKHATKVFAEVQKELEVDAIAFSGSSGAAIAFPLCAAHKVPLMYIRKAHERSHGANLEYISNKAIRRYMIVDDFVCSGATVRRIHKKVLDYANIRGSVAPECVGLFLYAAPFKCPDTFNVGTGKKELHVPVYTTR